MKTVLFNSGRSEYYKEKQARKLQEKRDRARFAEDAVYIKHYGMDAYIKLFPESLDMPISWHRSIIQELQRLEKQKLANYVSGIAIAVSASNSKKGAKHLKNLIKSLTD